MLLKSLHEDIILFTTVLKTVFIDFFWATKMQHSTTSGILSAYKVGKANVLGNNPLPISISSRCRTTSAFTQNHFSVHVSIYICLCYLMIENQQAPEIPDDNSGHDRRESYTVRAHCTVRKNHQPCHPNSCTAINSANHFQDTASPSVTHRL